MSETVVLAAITASTGLLGALLGAFSATRLEQRRERRRGAALRQAVRSDLVRWQIACFSAVERGRVTMRRDQGFRWHDVSGEVALHVPPGLYQLLFFLYAEREQVEVAYDQLMKGIPDEEAKIAFFALDRWSYQAEEVMSLDDAYYSRDWWHRRRSHELDAIDRTVPTALTLQVRDRVARASA